MKPHLLLAVALVAAPFTPLAPAHVAAGNALPFETVAQGTQSSFPVGGEIHLVIKTQTAWTRFWRQHAPGTLPPAVDFTTQDVYAVVLGTKPSSGYSVETVGLHDTGSTVHWDIHAVEPGPNCIVIPVFTRPFHFVKAPKTGVPALIFQVNEIVDC